MLNNIKGIFKGGRRISGLSIATISINSVCKSKKKNSFITRVVNIIINNFFFLLSIRNAIFLTCPLFIFLIRALGDLRYTTS